MTGLGVLPTSAELSLRDLHERLEQLGRTIDALPDIGKLQRDRTELLAAAKLTVEAADDPNSASGDIFVSIRQLRNAIDAAEEIKP